MPESHNSKTDANWKLRRKFGRYKLDLRFTLTLADGKAVTGWCRNIGTGGLEAIFTEALPEGAEVTIHLKLPVYQGSINTRALVRWSHSFNYGLQFVTLSTEQREALESLCKTLELAD